MIRSRCSIGTRDGELPYSQPVRLHHHESPSLEVYPGGFDRTENHVSPLWSMATGPAEEQDARSRGPCHREQGAEVGVRRDQMRPPSDAEAST
jgi:hypothetical protein